MPVHKLLRTRAHGEGLQPRPLTQALVGSSFPPRVSRISLVSPQDLRKVAESSNSACMAQLNHACTIHPGTVLMTTMPVGQETPSPDKVPDKVPARQNEVVIDLSLDDEEESVSKVGGRLSAPIMNVKTKVHASSSRNPSCQQRGVYVPNPMSREDAARVGRDSTNIPGNTNQRKISRFYLAQISVGCRLAVFCETEKMFFKATVTKKRRGKFPFLLSFDHGEEEWISLRQHRFRLLQGEKAAKTSEEESTILPNPTSQILLDINGKPHHIMVGSKISVWWPDEKRFFRCTVTMKRVQKMPYFLEYENGEREWVDLKKEKFYVVPK